MQLVYKFFRISITFILLYVFISFISSFINYKKFINRIDKDTKYIFLGHSHSEVAYNDKLINNSVNLAQSGESYFYTYYKLKALLSSKNNIDYVFLEFSNNMLGKNMDSAIYDDIHIKENLPKYLYFLDYESFIYLLKLNPFGFYNSLKLIFFKNIKYSLFVKSSTFSRYTGCYLPLNVSFLKNNNLNNYIFYSGSEYNLKYLNKIIDLCHSENKKIILIRTPLSKNYKGYLNEELFRKFLRNKNIIFWDYSKFFKDDKYFSDLSHLNKYGSVIYSKFLNNKLNK